MGLAADAVLRPLVSVLDVLNQDWVHGILSDGILLAEMGLLIDADEGAGRMDYEAFMKSDLRFPKQYAQKGNLLWRVFDSYRNSDDDTCAKIKADASELLGLYVVMRHFIEQRFKNRPAESKHKMIINYNDKSLSK